LLQATLKEEKATDEKLTMLAEQAGNQKAAQKTAQKAAQKTKAA
jgi:ferritin-like metal-binding protein YciE